MLQEQDKQKLDGIVQQMVANKESDSNIQLVVNDFKQKYSKQPSAVVSPMQQDQGGGGIVANLATGTSNILKDITGVEQNKSDAFIPSVIRSTYGSQGIAGVGQLPGKTIAALSEYGPGGAHQAEGLNQKAGEIANQAANLIVQSRSEPDPVKKQKLLDLAENLKSSVKQLSETAKGISEYTDTTAGQAIGTSINAGLTAATGGLGSLEKTAGANLLGKAFPALATLGKGTSAISPGLKALNIAGRVAENSAIGTGFQLGTNLANNKPATEGLGTAAILGGVIPAAGTIASKAKNAILEKATPAAEIFINSLIKPLQKDFAYGKNPAQGILREGITANSLEDLGHKVQEKIGSIGQSIGDTGQKIEKAGVSLNLTPALAPIDSAIQNAAKLNNQTLFHSLNNVKIALLHDLTVGADEKGAPAIVQGQSKNLLTAGYNEAKQFLSDIAEHTRFTGNPSDDKALNLATKQAYGITREIMNKGADSVSPELGATIRDLNTRYGDLLSAKSAINHRDIVIKRQNIVNLASKFGIHASVVGATLVGLATGDWQKAGVVLASELGAVVAGKVAGSTTVKTNVAQFLSKLAPEERNGILNSTPVLKQYYERLTGQTTPSPDAPKTKTLQTISDYIKNPKLGLSVDNIARNITSGEKGTLRDFTDWKNGAYKPNAKALENLKRDAQEIADKYGFSAATKGDQALSNQFGEYLDSVGFDKKLSK